MQIYKHMQIKFSYSQVIGLSMIGGMAKQNCSDITDIGEFCWTDNTKAILLGAYFYGYAAQGVSTAAAKKIGKSLPISPYHNSYTIVQLLLLLQ